MNYSEHDIEREARQLRAAEVERVWNAFFKSVSHKLAVAREIWAAFRQQPGVRA